MAHKTTFNGLGIKNTKQLKKQFKKMQEESEKAITRTVSDFKSRAPSWVSQSILEVYNPKRAKIKEAYKGARKTGEKFKLGNKEVDNYQLKYRGKPLTPASFSMKPATIPKKRLKERRLIPGQHVVSTRKVGDVASVSPVAPYQISAEVFKGKRETLDPKTTFLGSNHHGGYIPYQRRPGEERNKIKAVQTVSVPQMIMNEKVSKKTMDKISDGMEKRLQHHIENALKKV